MFEIKRNRLLLFLTALIAVFLLLQNCWQSKSASDKWLYLFEDSARDYAGQVLGVGRGTNVPIPERLAGTAITVYDTYVTFSPKSGPPLVLAFSPDAKPPAPDDPVHAGQDWIPLGDAWYRLAAVAGVSQQESRER